MVVVAVLASSSTAGAEQVEECSLERKSYDQATNELTTTKARGVLMGSSGDGHEICAEPERVQAWMNQGFMPITATPITSSPGTTDAGSPLGRGDWRYESAPRNAVSEPIIDGYMTRLIVFALLIVGLGVYIVRRR